MGEDELYYLTMKSLFAFSLFFCSAESQMNDSDYDDRGWSVYEESIIRAEKSIALYKEIVNKALYCKFVQSKRSKFTFRFKKTNGSQSFVLPCKGVCRKLSEGR